MIKFLRMAAIDFNDFNDVATRWKQTIDNSTTSYTLAKNDENPAYLWALVNDDYVPHLSVEQQALLLEESDAVAQGMIMISPGENNA